MNYYFNIKKVFNVSRNVFYPKPNVDSAVVMLERKKEKVKVDDEQLFFSIVKQAFCFKRKTLKNNLKNYDLEKIDKIMKTFNKNINYRAENITIEEFAIISNELTK